MTRGQTFKRCIIVDDDPDILLSARLLLRDLFEEVATFQTPEEAMAAMDEALPDVVLLDANFGRGATNAAEGFHWLTEILKHDPDAVVVMITAHGGVQIAVEAMKRGATDFISKPWSNERLLATVRTAAALRNTREEATTERKRAAVIATPAGGSETPILGNSPGMARVFSLIERAAPTEANVLILGENGTGKELVARALHEKSRRAGNVFVSVDLGAVAENLFESELFGHVKGAFTDARGDRIGRLQAANGGTLFLDEVGNLPLHLQPKLLTALEQREVTPVGANRPVPIDVRVIAATNLPPDRLADEGLFRQDLLFRLNTVEIDLPPLRDRRRDVPMLVDHFTGFYSRKYGKPPRAIPADVARALEEYDWPGNVRALRHACERAVILGDGEAFTVDDFSLSRAAAPRPAAATVPAAPSGGDDLNLERAERNMIEAALKRHGYNISLAAQDLGLTRASLYRRMEKHGL
ncbi:sigma-54-dependent transcriptional regulator [Allosphingosinicella indica]|uniref:DNA-binding transcriptional response regulator, NtrC family, contains REC, AAA-type ATPase, and a Fis-type DNA-binding domains n=1 Tax=Allosphingosinicella indica TaxID=941907 RepID=A0A1X7G919_9SPHN|nr:sigma-54 dependent transcriptional regulator [Allosphingosinicella indica]SMF66064.1 DNA-binding transcriptional response regulator, NtrC family, contains REC, AAA-type ATPase, and a Fis-type DNA-binding domains [Allosphingosinicella indica]